MKLHMDTYSLRVAKQAPLWERNPSVHSFIHSFAYSVIYSTKVSLGLTKRQALGELLGYRNESDKVPPGRSWPS